METSRKAALFIVFAVLFPLCVARANLEINEIMYDLSSGSDDGREWVEIYNNSSEAVDFSSYKFFEGNTNHKILLKQGSAKIPAGGYAIIVSDFDKFKTNWANFSGTVIDSSFSLSNTGEFLAIKDSKDTIVDQFSYLSTVGGDGDGKSIQKINGTWVAAAPSPGFLNTMPPPAPKIESQPKKTESAIATKAVEAPKEEVQTQIASEPETNLATNNSEEKIITNTGKPWYFYFVLVVILIILGVLSVYFVRKLGRKPNPGDDFEMVE